MNTILIIGSLGLVIVAALVTVIALKQEERKMKKYQTDVFSYEDELKRSHEYEQNSIKNVIPIQLWMYGIGLVFSIVLIVVFAVYY